MDEKPGESPKESGDARLARQGSLALSIPTLLLAGPLTGLLFNYGITRMFHLEGRAAKTSLGICLIIGFAGGVYETIKVLRRISSSGE